MNANDKKKEEERRLLDWLIQNHDLFDLPWEDNEPPDFAAIRDGKRIGLEITRFHHEDERIIKENNISKVRDLCTTKYANMKPAPSHVEVTCDYNKCPTKKRQREAVSDAIVKTLAEKYSGSPVVISGDDLPQILQEVSVTKIRATSPICFEHPTFWQFPQPGHLSKFSVEELQNILAAKNLTRKNYKNRFNETWLVIVTQQFGASSYVESIPDVIEVVSEFDRTFIFQNSTTCLHEIQKDNQTISHPSRSNNSIYSSNIVTKCPNNTSSGKSGPSTSC